MPPRGLDAKADVDRWNHNIHYGRRLLDLVPVAARNALDVGCGDGWLVRELADRVPHVVGLERDREMISMARGGDGGERAGVDYVLGDLLSCPFRESSFDFTVCVAALHHMDEDGGLRQMAALLCPGGTLAVVGLARSSRVRDVGCDLVGAVGQLAHRLAGPYHESPAPKVWPPPHSYEQLRSMSAAILPGSRFRRLAMWRYLLTWTKP